MPNFTIYGGRKQAMVKFFSFSSLGGVARGWSWGARDLSQPPLCEIIVLCSYNSGGQNAKV